MGAGSSKGGVSCGMMFSVVLFPVFTPHGRRWFRGVGELALVLFTTLYVTTGLSTRGGPNGNSFNARIRFGPFSRGKRAFGLSKLGFHCFMASGSTVHLGLKFGLSRSGFAGGRRNRARTSCASAGFGCGIKSFHLSTNCRHRFSVDGEMGICIKNSLKFAHRFTSAGLRAISGRLSAAFGNRVAGKTVAPSSGTSRLSVRGVLPTIGSETC